MFVLKNGKIRKSYREAVNVILFLKPHHAMWTDEKNNIVNEYDCFRYNFYDRVDLHKKLKEILDYYECDYNFIGYHYVTLEIRNKNIDIMINELRRLYDCSTDK